MTHSVVDAFRVVGELLPLEPDHFDKFNREIQAVIEIATPDLALKLAQLKLEVNRRLYWHGRVPPVET